MIAGIGLWTAQGGVADLLGKAPLAPATRVPWPPSSRATCSIGFAAKDAAGSGVARWLALAERALSDLGGRRDVPIVVGSCNGAADDVEVASWTRAFAELAAVTALPVASAACASGLHALWIGATLIEAGHDEVIVLAVDTLSRASHEHFEALRVLSAEAAPWQATATGFVPGEAAVALRLARGARTQLSGPVLAHDRDGADALGDVVRAVASLDVTLAIAQGTGPAAVDARELDALRRALSSHVPVATALAHFGHTVGASGLLSVALAVLARDHDLATLAMRDVVAADGRPLARGLAAHHEVLVACRALGGACAAVRVSAGAAGFHTGRRVPSWSAPSPPPPLRLAILRALAADLAARRPDAPPGAVIVRLDAPLVPPDDARIGGRLLPSVVLEITPGFLPQLIARAWGYDGPALCLVGGSDASWGPLLAKIRAVNGPTIVLHVHRRDFEWER